LKVFAKGRLWGGSGGQEGNHVKKKKKPFTDKRKDEAPWGGNEERYEEKREKKKKTERNAEIVALQKLTGNAIVGILGQPERSWKYDQDPGCKGSKKLHRKKKAPHK